MANAVAAAALRFGHTMVVEELARMDPAYRPHPRRPKLRLRNAFFAPVKDIAAAALVNKELTNHLFVAANGFPLDLGALNIQRGRDHALPLYNEWRSLCGLDRIQSWSAFAAEARDARLVPRVRALYRRPEDLDLWVGGLLERPIRGGKVGRTFSCLLADQFKRLRQGDRFWHEAPGVFGLRQLAALRKYSLAKLLCHNLDNAFRVPRDAFLHYQAGSRAFVRCDELADLDLSLWRIEGDGMAGSFECSSPDCTCRYQIGAWGPCSSSLERRRDLLVAGDYPPCTAQRTVARPCQGSSSPTSSSAASSRLPDGFGAASRRSGGTGSASGRASGSGARSGASGTPSRGPGSSRGGARPNVGRSLDGSVRSELSGTLAGSSRTSSGPSGQGSLERPFLEGERSSGGASRPFFVSPGGRPSRELRGSERFVSRDLGSSEDSARTATDFAGPAASFGTGSGQGSLSDSGTLGSGSGDAGLSSQDSGRVRLSPLRTRRRRVFAKRRRVLSALQKESPKN